MLALNATLLGIALGSLYAILGVSWSVIYTPTRIFHFAHGAVFTLAGYIFFSLSQQLGLPLIVGIIGAVLAAIALGLVVEFGVYVPLRRRNASHLIVFIASASVLTLVGAIITMMYGLAQINFQWSVRPVMADAPITNAQLTTIVVAVLLIIPLAIFLKKSPWGIRFRAIGDSHDAALRRGINIPRVYVLSFVVGSALVAPAAILQGWASGLRPEMGLHAALIATAVTLVAQSSNVLTVATVGLGIGVLQGLSLLVIPSGWQEGVTYAVLFIVVVGSVFVRQWRTAR